LIGLRKPRHEPLVGGAELGRLEQSEQPAERVVAGQAVLQFQQAAQERFLGNRKRRHVCRSLTAT
jgi:hypothetical protein